MVSGLEKNDLEVSMFKPFGILIVLTVLLFTTFSSAQLFDSIGGTLKDADIGGSLGGATTPATPADTSKLTYTPDPAVSAEVLQQFIDSLSSSGQATPEQLAQFEEAAKTELTREKMQQFIDQLFAGEGFKLENIADVFSMYLIASFVVLNDMKEGTTTEQDLIVRDQVVAAFANTPDMQQLSDKDKQTFSEALILFIIFLANDWQQALQGVEGYDLTTVKGYTQDTLLQMGIDPAQFDFTPQGLIRKGQGTPQTQTPNTQQTTPTTTTTPVSPEIQAQVDAMTPEELQAMVPQCQTAVANPDATQQVENGAMVLEMCQAILAKSGGTTPTTTTQTPDTQTPDTQQPDNQNNPLGGSDPANPLGGGTADPFVGSFSGDNLTLTLQGANNTYTGELNFNGQPFPVQATANGTNLTGTFTSGGSTFNFTATLQDTALTLVSDGSTFNLTKQ
jgi:hypothetical protein